MGEALSIANTHLGPIAPLQTDWTTLKNRFDPFEGWGRPAEADLWQFETFLLG